MHDLLNIEAIDVHELLPQQEPFVMIHRLVALDERTTVTETTVTDGNIFADNGRLSASGLIENVAQTCAARIGYVNKYVRGNDIQLGFIASVRNLQVVELPWVGQTITTTVEIRDEILGMTLAAARVESEGRTLLTTEMKIAAES